MALAKLPHAVAVNISMVKIAFVNIAAFVLDRAALLERAFAVALPVLVEAADVNFGKESRNFLGCHDPFEMVAPEPLALENRTIVIVHGPLSPHHIFFPCSNVDAAVTLTIPPMPTPVIIDPISCIYTAVYVIKGAKTFPLVIFPQARISRITRFYLAAMAMTVSVQKPPSVFDTFRKLHATQPRHGVLKELPRVHNAVLKRQDPKAGAQTMRKCAAVI